MWQHRANISWLKQSVADGLSRRDWRLEHMAPGPCTWGSFPPLPPGHWQSSEKVTSFVPHLVALQSGQDWLNFPCLAYVEIFRLFESQFTSFFSKWSSLWNCLERHFQQEVGFVGFLPTGPLILVAHFWGQHWLRKVLPGAADVQELDECLCCLLCTSLIVQQILKIANHIIIKKRVLKELRHGFLSLIYSKSSVEYVHKDKQDKLQWEEKKTFNRGGDPAPGIPLFEIEARFTTVRVCAGGNFKASWAL